MPIKRTDTEKKKTAPRKSRTNTTATTATDTLKPRKRMIGKVRALGMPYLQRPYRAPGAPGGFLNVMLGTVSYGTMVHMENYNPSAIEQTRQRLLRQMRSVTPVIPPRLHVRP